jgi:hypothetical protein
MTNLTDIERAIERLSDADMALLREWFEERDARLFDEKLARDAASGILDATAQRAVADHAAGRTRKL